MTASVMGKHTPGPWLAASKASSIVGRPVVGPNGEAIANVHEMMARPEGIDDKKWASYKAACDANARLIAAAPDLLEALTYIARPWTPLKEGEPSRIETARKALADYGAATKEAGE